MKKMYVKRTKVYQCKDCRVKIAISDIEGMFWGFLSDCLSNIELSKINENSNSLLGKKQALLEETKSEKATLETKINRCTEMRMDGEITKENFTANFYLLKTQLANLEELLKNLRSEMDSEMHQIALGKDLFNEIQLLVYNWTDMAFARKRSIIETVTKEILVSKNDIIIEFSINLQKLLGDRKFQHNSPLVLPSLLFKLEFRKPIHQNYPQNPTTIGEHLRKKRIDSDLSQAELAKILGVSTDCLTYWENNRSSPQITYYPRIHHFLGFYTTTFNETKFCDLLRSYRWKDGFSFRALGSLLKVDATTVRAWEKGLSLPSRKMNEKLVAVFGDSFSKIKY
ncbi:helix-turn-helix transcriptional regulator [Sphingobacterium hotanense]|uniref:Helix-turn-helix transcriptional regulator n=2 Tax=Sphingobacterium hotanense TaxID=649196 RepID=A0ABT7NMG2_9SPHI|nr:helix-turn-helix transcriptional regulator [Sphingobacterium hotanense]